MSEPSSEDWRLANSIRSKKAQSHDIEPPLARLFAWCREVRLDDAHYVDVLVRRNGKNERYEEIGRAHV